MIQNNNKKTGKKKIRYWVGLEPGTLPLQHKGWLRNLGEKSVIYSSYHQHAPSKGFFFGLNLRFGGRQSTVTMVSTRWPREDSFPVSRALRGQFRRLSRLCNILLQDLTPLPVKITRSTNLLSVCRRKLKLSTYLNTVSYNHVGFLNTHLQLVWDLASSGFYSTSRIRISRSAGYKIHFRKQPPFRGNLCPLSVWYLSFLWIYAPWQFVQGSRVFIQSNK